VLHVAVAAGRNRDRIYNDAPATVPDANGGGRINAIDLKAYGVASDIVTVPSGSPTEPELSTTSRLARAQERQPTPKGRP
jgi:hypothetical protein